MHQPLSSFLLLLLCLLLLLTSISWAAPSPSSPDLSRSQWLSHVHDWQQDWETTVIQRYVYAYYHGLTAEDGVVSPFQPLRDRRLVEMKSLRDTTTALLQTLERDDASDTLEVDPAAFHFQTWYSMVQIVQQSLEADYKSLNHTAPSRYEHESYCVTLCRQDEDMELRLHKFVGAFNATLRVWSRAGLLRYNGIALFETDQEHQRATFLSRAVFPPWHNSISFIQGHFQPTLHVFFLVLGGVIALYCNNLIRHLKSRSPVYNLFPTPASHALYVMTYDFAELWETHPIDAAFKQAATLRTDILPLYPFLNNKLGNFLRNKHTDAPDVADDLAAQFEFLTSKVQGLRSLVSKQLGKGGLKSQADKLGRWSLKEIEQNRAEWTEQARFFQQSFVMFWIGLSKLAGEVEPE